MNVFQAAFIQKKTVADQTHAFYFGKPEGFIYAPGQFVIIRLSFPLPVSPRDSFHQYSLASAPAEEELMIVTRMRETPFKQHLAQKKQGETVSIQGPFGQFLKMDTVKKPIVFMAGGVGIAPFRSFLRQKTDVPVTLFYFNREVNSAPFFEDLSVWAQSRQTLSFVPVMTRAKEEHGWNGEKGYLSKALLSKHVADMENATYYIVGPPKMAIDTKHAVVSYGVPEESVHFEVFTGY